MRLLAGETEDDVFAAEEPSRRRAEPEPKPRTRRSRKPRPFPLPGSAHAAARARRRLAFEQNGGRELAAADRGALRAPVGDGRRQRHARLVLGRRRPPAARARPRPRRSGCSTRARRSSTSAASRPGPAADGVAARRGAAPGRAGARGARRARRSRSTPSKAEVARRALELGAELVNDVTALRGDPELAGVVADAGAYLCLMHMRGEPRTMQADPRYDDVVSEVKAFLEERLAFAVARGDPRGARLPRSRDRLRQDGRAQLRARAPARRARRDRPAGADRLLAQELARAGSSATRRRRSARRRASVGAAVAAYERGATILRVHDVREHVEALRAAQAVYAGRDRRAARARALRPPRRRTRRSGAQGQRFLYDVELEVGERGADDRIEDAVDYREVAAAVREVGERPVRLLEALATAVADALVERFAPRAREGARAQAGGAAGRASTSSSAAVTVERRRDASPTSGSARTSATARQSIRAAAELIGARRLSTIRETEPWGVDRPAAVPERRRRARDRARRRGALLERLLEVERELGRVRDGARWGPRDDRPRPARSTATEAIDEPGLTVPHPQLARAAVRARAARRARARARSCPGCGVVSALVREGYNPPP